MYTGEGIPVQKFKLVVQEATLVDFLIKMPYTIIFRSK